MRAATAAILLCCCLAAPAAATASSAPPGRWSGTWADAASGTRGPARLVPGKTLRLRLAGAALGCAEPVLLPVGYAHGLLEGRGHDVACNAGLRWTLRARVAQGVAAGRIALRLADGSRASLTLELRRR